MSYCRIDDDSDVYVIMSRSTSGDPLWIIYTDFDSEEHLSEQSTIDALLAMRERGLKVPERAIERLRQEAQQ